MIEELRGIATCITIPIYSVLLFVLIKYRKTHFQSPFYILYISTGFADIFSCFVSIAFVYIPTYVIGITSYVESSLPFATIAMAMYYYIEYTQILGIIAISANRLTAIASPFKHALVWSERNVICVLLVQWMLPMLWIVPTLNPCCQCQFINGSILPEFKSDLVQDIWYAVDGIAGMLIAPPAIIATNVLIMVYMHKINRARKIAGTYDQHTKTEVRLAVVGVTLSVIYTAAVLGQFLLYAMILGAFPYSDNIVQFTYQWFINIFGLFTIINPYLLLFLSTVARSQFFACFGFKESVSPILFTTTNHR